MNKDNLVKFLNHSNLVSFSTAQEIAAYFVYKFIAKQQLHLTAGKVSDEYLFLEKGCMRTFAHNTESNEVTTGFFAKGEMVFEVNSFFNRTRSKENIQALTDCEGWFISYKQLNSLFHTLPQFREFGRWVLVKGYAALKNRMLSMITETAEERYEHLFKTQPEVFQHAPLKYIASYLGITDSSLSRIRRDLLRRS